MDRHSAERTIRRLAAQHPDWLLHALGNLPPSVRESLAGRLFVSSEGASECSTEEEEAVTSGTDSRSGKGAPLSWGRLSMVCVEFLRGARRTCWPCTPSASASASAEAELFLYVDDSTVLEVVEDAGRLRRGDHCLTVLNAVRTLNARVDWTHSVLGKWGLGTVFHHFVVLEDVACVDQFGVPRTSTGAPVGILEYSNTIQGFLDEAEEIGIMANFLKKANCQRVPLAEYGHMPHILRVAERLSEDERDERVRRACTLIDIHPPYHMLIANCEHTTNLVCTASAFNSPQVTYVAENLVRYVLHGLGLVALIGISDSLWLFHLFTSLPVLVQATRAALKTRRALLHHEKTAGSLSKTQRRRLQRENVLRHTLVTAKTLAAFQLLADSLIQHQTSARHPLVFHVVAIVLCKIYYLADVLFTLLFRLSRSASQILALRFSSPSRVSTPFLTTDHKNTRTSRTKQASTLVFRLSAIALVIKVLFSLHLSLLALRLASQLP